MHLENYEYQKLGVFVSKLTKLARFISNLQADERIKQVPKLVKDLDQLTKLTNIPQRIDSVNL